MEGSGRKGKGREGEIPNLAPRNSESARRKRAGAEASYEAHPPCYSTDLIVINHEQRQWYKVSVQSRRLLEKRLEIRIRSLFCRCCFAETESAKIEATDVDRDI